MCMQIALVGERQDIGSSDLERVEELDGKVDPFFKDAIEEMQLL